MRRAENQKLAERDDICGAWRAVGHTHTPNNRTTSHRVPAHKWTLFTRTHTQNIWATTWNIYVWMLLLRLGRVHTDPHTQWNQHIPRVIIYAALGVCACIIHATYSMNISYVISTSLPRVCVQRHIILGRPREWGSSTRIWCAHERACAASCEMMRVWWHRR